MGRRIDLAELDLATGTFGNARDFLHASIDLTLEPAPQVTVVVSNPSTGRVVTPYLGYDLSGVAGLGPYESRVFYGGRCGDACAKYDIDNIDVQYTPLAPPENAAPVADAGPDQSVPCDEHCTAQVTLDGSGSADADGDSLTYEWTGPFGAVSGAAPVVTLEAGTHVITLTVDDGNGGTATDTVTVTVRDEIPPVFTSVVGPFTISVSGTSGTPFTVPLPGATDNCIDVLVTSDAPPLFPMGATTVTFTATDSAGNSVTTTTTVTVVNAAPVAVDDAASTTAASAVAIDVLANDTDADGHALAVTGVTQGSHGAVVINGDGTVTYTPAVPTLAGLIARVGALPLNRGQINSLLSKLDAASRSLARGNETAARNQIQAFVNEVEAMARSGRIDSGVAAELIAWARALGGGGSVTDSFTYTVSDGFGGTASAAVSITIAMP